MMPHIRERMFPFWVLPDGPFKKSPPPLIFYRGPLWVIIGETFFFAHTF